MSVLRPPLVRRLLALVSLAAAALAVALILRGNSGYTVVARFENASQIVPGNEVQIGGVAVGSVDSVDLADDGEAELRLSLDSEVAPLHQGTIATVRVTSLASRAGRYVSLAPGPNNAPAIPDGGTIGAQDTISAVDFDQLLDFLDPRTVHVLQNSVGGVAAAVDGRGHALSRAIHYLYPTLAQGSRVLGEASSDQHALRSLLAHTADVADTLARRHDDLVTVADSGSRALGAIASRRRAIAESLGRTPGVLRQANTTFVNLRATLTDARPAIAGALPVARELSADAPVLESVTSRLRSELAPLRALVRTPGPRNDLVGLLRGLPRLDRVGTPVVENLAGTVQGLQPVLDELRPYTPDFIGGLPGGFMGSATGYYDANGDYARIGVIGGPFSGTGLPIKPPSTSSLETGITSRCPGGAIYPAPDSSNPFLDHGQLSWCDPSSAGSAP
jgi:phospholipid/cholesterol/gamma-HCH transport system substrate-binding protein